MPNTTYLIEDPNYSQKQNQIFIWLRFVGFATWRQIHNVCLSLTEPDSLEVKKWYSNYPIYKLFYPLLNAGVFEVAFNKQNNKNGFSIAARIPLYDKGVLSNKEQYLSLFENEGQQELLSAESCKKNALLLLNSIPALYDQILLWPQNNDLYKGDKYYIRDIYNKKYSENKSFIDEPNIISAYNNSFSSEYIALQNKDGNMEFHLLDIDKNCDAMNISCCYLMNYRGIPIFEYDPENKELSCINIYDYSMLPILIQRALLLHDISEEQIFNQTKYLHNGKPFTNIDEITVKLIQRIFGQNSIRIKE